MLEAIGHDPGNYFRMVCAKHSIINIKDIMHVLSTRE